MSAEQLEFGEAVIDPISYGEYQLLAHDFAGPQLVEYSELDFARTIRDPRTRYASIDVYGETKAWPALTPIANYTEYVPDYFAGRYGEHQVQNTYHLSLPTTEALGVHAESHREIAEQIMRVSEGGGIVVYDEMQGEDRLGYVRAILADQGFDVDIATDDFIDDKNGTPAAAVHHAALAVSAREPSDIGIRPNSVEAIRQQYNDLVEKGEVDLTAQNKTVLLDPARMDDVLETGDTSIDRLWNIYEGQFSKLIENNPCRGAQTRQELEMMARDPGTFTVAHMVEGDIVSFAMFVSNIESCDWLNADYYKDSFPGEVVLYFPGIATDIEKQGNKYSLNLVDTLTRIITPCVDSVRIVFQCTNVSNDYIPTIVQMGVNMTGRASIDNVDELCRYNYRALKITPRTDNEQ